MSPRIALPRNACVVCGDQVNDPKPERRYCSKACEARARTLPRQHCHVCGVELADRRAVACNRHRHAAKRQKRERPCAHCGKTFVPYPSAMLRHAAKFCSKACYNLTVAPRLAMITVSCLKCGVTFRRTQAAVNRVARHFCSEECAHAYLRREQSPGWRGGHDANRGPNWRALAETIRERDGYRCRMCGKTQAENGQRLSVDHIIPWRVFESADEANQSSNLVALCRSCHAKKQKAETQWLRGDVLAMQRYQKAVAKPWPQAAA